MDEEAVGTGLMNLSVSDREEVQRVLERTQQQAQISRMVHSLSQVCFKKCITGKITSDTLSSSEQSCAANCVGRWLDVQTGVVKNLATGMPSPAQQQPKSGGFFG